MTHREQRRSWIFKVGRRTAIATLGLVVVLALTLGVTSAAQAQTFQVLHTFTGKLDGANPEGAGLTMDRAGNLYGAAAFGGLETEACSYFGSCGTVYKLSRKGSGWVFNTLYLFTGGTDGNSPDTPIAFGLDGLIYGTTFYGGIPGPCDEHGCGIIYSLRPAATACKSALCPWSETVLYRFTGEDDGGSPAFGAFALDQAGNLYGTALGGAYRSGIVYELIRDNGQWTLNVLYSFTGQSDGSSPWSGVTADAAGNFYGTTLSGGLYQDGTAWELSPTGQGWTLTPIHQFLLNSDGYRSEGNLLLDSSGNLWGANEYGGPGGGGTVFELTPSSGSWNFSVVHSFTQIYGSQAPLVMDPAGNLYGTSVNGGTYGYGTAFKMSPSDGGWSYTVLHNFTGGSDGANPYGQIVLDGNGNLYGTTFEGGMGPSCYVGSNGCGVVWEITP